MVAREAGVTEPLLYQNVKTIRDLQLAALDRIYQALLSIFGTVEKRDAVSLSDRRMIGTEFQSRISEDPLQIKVFLKAIALEDPTVKEKAWLILGWSHLSPVMSVLGKQDEMSADRFVEFVHFLTRNTPPKT